MGLDISDTNKINALFSQFQSMIACDGPCQEKKQAENLKQKMLDAQTKIKSANPPPKEEKVVSIKNFG